MSNQVDEQTANSKNNEGIMHPVKSLVRISSLDKIQASQAHTGLRTTTRK